MKLKTLAIVLVIVILGIVAYIGIRNNNTGMELLVKNDVEDIKTELLQVRAKLKVIKEQSVVKNDESIIKGERLQDSEQEYVKNCFNVLKENEIINADDEKLDKYYLWDKNLLQELNLSLQLKENSYIVVNYETLEVIVTSGFKLSKDGEILYKLSDIV